jgi:hypothetical protein
MTSQERLGRETDQHAKERWERAVHVFSSRADILRSRLVEKKKE